MSFAGEPVIGPMVDNDDVEQAVLATIAYWLDMYLGAKEVRKGWPRGKRLARPGSYIASYDNENWPEAQIPAIIVECLGTVDDVIRGGNGVGAWFEVMVHAIVTGTSEAEAKQVASAYQSTVATLLEQQPNLECVFVPAGENSQAQLGNVPFATETSLIEWRVELPDPDNRTLADGMCTFHVHVDRILDPWVAPGPPAIPSSDDPGTQPVADSVNPTYSWIPEGQQIAKG